MTCRHRSTKCVAMLLVAGAAAGAQPVFPWQVNGPASSLDLDGVLATPFTPALTAVCAGSAVVATFASSGTGLPWEAAVGFLPVVPQGSPGSLTTPGGQVVNLDTTDPALFFVFGGTVPAPAPFPGNFSAPFAAGPPGLTAAIQQFNADASHPDGFALSQACQLDVAAGSVPVPGPFDDDGFVTITLGAPPLCGPPAVPFFGTAFTQMQVTSNGRIIFGAPSVAPSPTIFAALTDDPSFGAWCDFDPSSGGSVVTSVPSALAVRVTWTSVPYFASALTSSFSLQIDASGTIVLNGLTGIPPFAGPMFLGLSAGTLGATDPGPTAFGPLGTLVPGPAGLGMLYRLGPAGTLAAGANSLTFVPNATGNYGWLGL